MRFPITAIDIIISVILIVAIYIVTSNIKQKYIGKAAYFKYFQQGLFVRIIAGIFFAYVYLIFYGGGDTIYYFKGAGSIAKVALKDFGGFIRLMSGEQGDELYSLFNWETGYPTYYRDANAFAVNRFLVPFYILGFGSYWATTIVLISLMYIPLWKFYQMVCSFYPKQAKYLAFGILFFPSLVFWSSGILKDIWCLTALIVMYRTIWYGIIKKRKTIKNILLFLFWSYVLISIRPFMFYTGIITILLWIGLRATSKIESGVFRTLAFPFMMIIVGGIITVTISSISSNVAEGKYSTVDSMLETAVIIQDDLSRTEAYGANTFDIGDFDASIPSMLAKAPVAILAGLARPFIWEAGSILMFFSGLESSFYIIMLSILFFRSGIIGFFILLRADSFLLSCFVFAIMFAFFVGLTTANFGALVRYKIALLPFINIVIFRLYALIVKKE